MEAARWVRGLGSLGVLAAIATQASGGPAVLGDVNASWQPPPCVATSAPVAPVTDATRTWYRVEPVLDRAGTLAGQHLTVGGPGRRTSQVDLPPESFATGPVHGLLLVGDDDASRSRLRLIDLVEGCVRSEAVDAAVIRTAVIDPGMTAVWEHRVDRETREDLGVWRRTPDDAVAVQVLPGLTPDLVHGPTFTTELRPSPDGHLVVASCGAVTCRTRILDPGIGRVEAVDGTGPAIGLVDGRLIAYGACGAAGCPVIAIDPATGRRTTLADDAGPAELGGTDHGTLVYQAGDGALISLGVRTLRRVVVRQATDVAPVRGGSAATAGADLAPGALLLARGGWLSGDPGAASIDPTDNTIEPFEEARP
jgi:hypothetical protein